MKYTLSDVKKTLTTEKNKGDSMWVRLVARKCSFPLTVLFLNGGLSAWFVSIISVFVALCGCICLSIDIPTVRIMGTLFIELWMILDCTDGNIARVKKTTGPSGEFIDAVSGYVISGFLYMGLGLAAFHTSNIFVGFRYIWIIFGSVASIANVLPRLMHQKYLAVMLNSGKLKQGEMNAEEKTKGSIQAIRRRIGKELGLSGVMMPLLIFSAIWSIYDLLCIFYMMFSLGAFLVMLVVYSQKARI